MTTAPTLAAPHSSSVLDLPSATTMRFVLLAAAMLVAGLFVGITIFNAVDGQAIAGCALHTDAACVAGEHRYALFALGGTLGVAAGALAVVLAAPAVVVRRRRLRDPGPLAAAAQARLATFCADAGIRRPPRLLLGSASLRDAFCMGRPGRYAVAVPPALLIRSHMPLFEVALRHELAHVRHQDVAVSWLARSVWYALAPLLLVPVVMFALTGDLLLLPEYLWRAAALGVVVTLAARSALRSRELSADVAAARLAGPAAITAALHGLAAATTARWRRILAVHPTRDERLAAVLEPGRTATLNAVDGAVVGFLVTFALPALDLFLTAALIGTDFPFVLASAALLGLLAGTTLGLGLYRQAAAGLRTSIAPLLGGVAAGALLGQLTSLAGVGLDGVGGFGHPALILVAACALTGATVLTAGCGEMWAGVHALRAAAVVVTAAAIVLFTTALWAADDIAGVLDLAGWFGAAVDLREELQSSPLTPVALALAVAVACAFRRRRPTPGPRAGATLAAGVAAGVGGVAVLVGTRILLGAPVDQDTGAQRFMDNWWIAAAAAAAAAAGLALTSGRRGWGAGLLAGPIAALVVGLGQLGQLTVTNGLPLPPGTVSVIMGGDIALGLLVTVPIAALVPAWGAPVPARSTALVVVSAALLAVGAGSAAAAGSALLTGPAAVSTTPTPAPVPVPKPVPTPSPQRTLLSTADYKPIAHALALEDAAVQSEIGALERSSVPAATQVEQINGRILPDLQRLLGQAEAIQPTDPAVAQLHGHLITSLQLAIAAQQVIATGLTQNDPSAPARALIDLDGEAAALKLWQTGVSQL